MTKEREQMYYVIRDLNRSKNICLCTGMISKDSRKSRRRGDRSRGDIGLHGR